MTSECFVYVMLLGQTRFVTAGCFVLKEIRRDLALAIGVCGRYANATNLIWQCARFLFDSRLFVARIVTKTFHKGRELLPNQLVYQ